MTRLRPLKTSLLTAAGLCLTASAAMAQVPSPPTVTPIAPPTSPIEGLPPPPVTAPMAPVATMPAAPRSADDLTGAVGFGVGLTANSVLVGTNAAVAIKYWTSDALALVPALNFAFGKGQNSDATWNLSPELVVLFAPVKGTSTRLQLGGGLGLGVGKAAPSVAVPTPETSFILYIPIQAGVEHFLTRWFSLGIAARSNLFYLQTGDPWSINMAISTTSLFGQLFFYTD